MEELGLIKYDITEAAITTMESEFMGLTIAGLDDKLGLENVHSARMVVKSHRVAVQKREQDYKDQLNAKKKDVTDQAKAIYRRLEPIETHLQREEDRIFQEKKRIQDEKARKERERIDGIRAKMATMQRLIINVVGMRSDAILNSMDILMDTTINESEYQEFTTEAIRMKDEIMASLMTSYQQTMKSEQDIVAILVEQTRLAKQKSEQDATQAKIDEENRKIREAQEKIEADRKAEESRIEIVALEKRLAEEANVKAVKELQEKSEREALEKERQELLKPDKQKLMEFAGSLYDIRLPDVQSVEANAIKTSAGKKLADVAKHIISQTKNL